MNQQKKAYVFALMAILFWSTMSTAFKLTLQQITVVQLLLFACLSSIIILFTVLLFQKKLHLFNEISAKEYRSSAILGLINPFLYYLILFKAYDMLEAQVAGTLNYFWPVVLVLLSIPLLKQKIGAKSIIAILVSFFGIILISTEGRILSLNFSNPTGVGLALSSAFLWALYWIFNMKDKREDVSKLFLNFCFGTLYILIYILIFDEIYRIFRNGNHLCIMAKSIKPFGEYSKSKQSCFSFSFYGFDYNSVSIGRKYSNCNHNWFGICHWRDYSSILF